MKVFLGWSGTRRFETAQAFDEWLPKVIQAVDSFISSGIPKGKRWGEALADELEETKIGILCLTRENLNASWILYEAGALSKTKDAYVCTFLLDLKPADIEEPLASFQHTTFEKNDIRKLMDTINKAVEDLGERSLSENHLDTSFELFWPDIEEKLKKIAKKQPGAKRPIRDQREILEEILGIVRTLESRQRQEVYKMMKIPAYKPDELQIKAREFEKAKIPKISPELSTRFREYVRKEMAERRLHEIRLKKEENDTDNSEDSEG